MENKIFKEEDEVIEQNSQLHQVTPTSKYLSMTLFVVMPFIGAWMGYQYAPDKIVEIEKIVEVEKEVEVVKIIEVDRSSATLSGSENTSVDDVTDVVLEKQTVPPTSNEVGSAQEVESVDPYVKISVPAAGQSFCLGDQIEITWEAPAGVEYFGVGLNRPNWGMSVGQQLGYRDSDKAIDTYKYNWDMRDKSGALVEPGHLYSFSVASFDKDGINLAKGFSVDKFSIIDCNL